MSRRVLLHLYFPQDFFGNLICWRLESAFSHATIQIGEAIYSATFPKIVGVPPDDAAFGMVPLGGRTGQTYELKGLSDIQISRMDAWCRGMIGSDYDIIAMIGWAFRWQWAQRPGHCYCFEFVYDALAAAGVFPSSKGLITGDQLLAAALLRGLVETPTQGSPEEGVIIRATGQKLSPKLEAAV